MRNELFSITYTTYQEPDLDYCCGGTDGWKRILEKQLLKAQKILKNYRSNRIFFEKYAWYNNYLINGNFVRENKSISHSIDHGWCLTIFSETEKGLKEITGKLDLPLKFN